MEKTVIAFNQPKIDNSRNYDNDVALFTRYFEQAIASKGYVKAFVPIIDHVNYKAYMDAAMTVKEQQPDALEIFALIPYKEMFEHVSDDMFTSCTNVYENCDDQHLYDYSRDGSKLPNHDELQVIALNDSVTHAEFIMAYNPNNHDELYVDVKVRA